MTNEFKIFVDFDGTITKRDVGDSMFQEFGPADKVESIISDLLSDKISAKECWLQLCKSVESIDAVKLNEFIDTIEIDNSFHLFFKYCKENNFDLYVLSDGFDYYINRIFTREGITDIKVFCNQLTVENNKLVPKFPYLDEDCHTSANCKRNHIINNSSDDDFTFYIGDGNSDRNPAQYCDFIFAKDDLLKFCEKERISFFPYKNFNDIINRLDELKARKRLKKRHQAELKRRERYMIE